jgi:DNA-binding transcriptional LysR family regulator
MMHERELLQQDLRSVASKPVGNIVIGAVPTAVPIAARFAAMLQAQHPSIMPTVLSMTSDEIESGLEKLSLDLGLGYTDRLQTKALRLRSLPQYAEHYFLVQKSAKPNARNQLKIGTKISWKHISKLPLCLLTPDMHNRSIVDAAFAQAGVTVKPIMATNSLLTLALSVVAGELCTILPGAMLDTVRGYAELEALPLEDPVVSTPIGFMMPQSLRTSHTQLAALTLAEDANWLKQATEHSGLLNS